MHVVYGHKESYLMMGQAWEALGEQQPHHPGEISHQLGWGDLLMVLAVNTLGDFGLLCPMGFLSGGRLNIDEGWPVVGGVCKRGPGTKLDEVVGNLEPPAYVWAEWKETDNS